MKKVLTICSFLLVVVGVSNVNAQTRVNISINTFPVYSPRPVVHRAPAPPQPVAKHCEPKQVHRPAKKHFHKHSKHEVHCRVDNRDRRDQHFDNRR